MNLLRITTVAIALSSAFLLGSLGAAQAHTLDVTGGEYVSFADLVADLQQVRLVFVGELHDNLGHHQAQLQVIEALHEAGVPVAIGLEMFRSDSQKALDRWVVGDIPEKKFLRIFENNWSMWPVYRDIFISARERGIPMLGLNIRRDITQRVARSGFASLSPQQIGELPGRVRCDVDEKYKAYIRRVLGGHAHNGATFDNFCEAQLLWDSVMADALLDYLERNPERTVVVLAGSGHAWKHGIPEQISRIREIPYRVLLPEIAGRLQADDVSPDEADYLLLGLEEGPLH